MKIEVSGSLKHSLFLCNYITESVTSTGERTTSRFSTIEIMGHAINIKELSFSVLFTTYFIGILLILIFTDM